LGQDPLDVGPHRRGQSRWSRPIGFAPFSERRQATVNGEIRLAELELCLIRSLLWRFPHEPVHGDRSVQEMGDGISHEIVTGARAVAARTVGFVACGHNLLGVLSSPCVAQRDHRLTLLAESGPTW
jgi:hypothetical protein